MIEDELTYNIIGCAMKVHKTMGNGFQEVIYQRCLAIELRKLEGGNKKSCGGVPLRIGCTKKS
jgi:GxxExxY protein